MLATQPLVTGPGVEQGCFRTVLTELQRQAAAPSRCSDGLRQRLLVLARRLASVQSLGGEYARVDLSDQAKARLDGLAQAV